MYRTAHLAGLLLAPLLVTAAAVPASTTPRTLSTGVNPDTWSSAATTTLLAGPFVIHTSPGPRPFRHIRRQDLTQADTALVPEDEAEGFVPEVGPVPTATFDDGLWHPDVSDSDLAGDGQDGDEIVSERVTLSDEVFVTLADDSASAQPASTSAILISASSSASTARSVYVKKPKPTTVSSKGGLVTGAQVPEQCAQGCADTFAHINACEAHPSTCPNLCDYITYTAAVKCFNCLVGNAAPDIEASTLRTILHDVGDMCEGVGHKLMSYGRVTAEPTATGRMVRFDLEAGVTDMPWTWTRTSDGARKDLETGRVALKTGAAGRAVGRWSWGMGVGIVAVLSCALRV